MKKGILILFFYLIYEDTDFPGAKRTMTTYTVDFGNGEDIEEKLNLMEIQGEIDNLQGTTMQDKLDILNQCNCCDRHQTNKPRLYKPWYGCQSNGMMQHEDYVQCECYCRHMARWVCRTCIDGGDNMPTGKTSEENWATIRATTSVTGF